MSAAGAAELATAYLSIVPSLKGARESISSQMSPAAAAAGSEAGEGLGRGIVGMAAKWAAPIAAAVGFGKILKTGFEGVLDDEANFAQLAVGIKSTGDASNTSLDGLKSLAQGIQDYSGQSGNAIMKSEQLLLTFTNIKNNGPDKIFDQATKASADMAAKFGGDASSQAVLLGKALNDPVKGITALTRVGVSFSDGQKNTIAALMKTGDVAGAQKVILGELNTEFGGAAEAAGQALPGQLQRAHRAFEDLGKGIVGAFIPIMGGSLEGVIKVLHTIGPVAASGAQLVAKAGEKITGAVGAVFSLFKTGDFTHDIGKALGIEEDSPVVGAILTIRTKVVDGVTAISKAFKDAKAGFMLPNMDTSKMTPALAAAVNFGKGLRDTFNDAKATVGPIFSSLGQVAAPVMDVFKTLAPTLSPLVPQLFTLAGALSPVQLVFKAMLPVLPALLGALGQLAGSALKAVLSIVTALVPVAVQLSGVLIKLLSGAIIQLMPTVIQVVGMLSKIFAQLGPIVGQVLAALMPLVTMILGVVVQAFTLLLPPIMSIVTMALPLLTQILGVVVSAIVPVVQILAAVLIPVIQALLPVVQTVFTVIAAVITSVMQIVQGIIQVVLGIITGNWSEVWTGLGNILSGIWNTIVAVVSGALSFLSGYIGAVLGIIGGIWNGVWSGISGFFGGIWSGLIGAAQGGLGQIIGFFQGLGGQVLGALAGAGGWLIGVGRDMINGLLSGIGSMVGAIGNAILSLIPGPIVGVFKAALGINSPSRVFKGFGENTVQGYIDGVTGMHDQVKTAVAGTAAAATGAFNPSLAAAGTGAGGLAGGGGVTLKQENTFTGMSEETAADLAARRMLRMAKAL